MIVKNFSIHSRNFVVRGAVAAGGDVWYNTTKNKGAKAMMFGIIPLVPVAWFALGALFGGGGTILIINRDKDKPPYEKPADAYNNYVKAVEEIDYNRYQWAVEKPMPEAEFTMRCDQRNKLAPIKEGLDESRITWFEKEKTEASAIVISPWSREGVELRFKKVGKSWKVIDGR